MRKWTVEPNIPHEIIRRSARLRLTNNYWKGKPDRRSLSPGNILLFPRRVAARLMENPQAQHHRFLLITNMEGAGKVAVDDKIFSLREGECLLVFPFQSHCYLELLPSRINWIFISFDHGPDDRLEPLKNRGALPLDQEGFLYLRNTLRAWLSVAGEETLPLHLGLWLHHQLQTARGKRPPPIRKMAASKDSENLVARVNQLLLGHRDEALSVGKIAARLGVSASSLRTRFQTATGRAIGRHAREIRLNYACEFLCTTDLRIEEISRRCGYESVFAFSRAFRTSQGCAPSHYRRRRIRGTC